ncbi:MFS general substrate transporter [Atractiella rhizophila]|nr:MFS general substrate transporter [Atractiella rhizophila]
MSDLLRESVAGQLIRVISRGRILRYPEEKDGFEVPLRFCLQSNNCSPTTTSTKVASASPSFEAATIDEENHVKAYNVENDGGPEKNEEDRCRGQRSGVDNDLENGKKVVDREQVKERYLVDWYGDDDPENPQNWSVTKKSIVTAGILLLTYSLYIGSAIYSSSIPGVMEYFHVSQTKATLGLSLFVLGYGLGPMILSPLSEIPAIGRNPIYMATLFLFVILQIPAATTSNYNTLMATRFFAGFIGSPVFATAGASFADVWAPIKLPYVYGLWSVAAEMSLVLGPVISGFAAMNSGWRWPLYELLILSGFTLLVLSFTLPETSASTILLKRAQRLRKLLNNKTLRAQSEIDQANTSAKDVLYETLIRPFQLALEPAVLFINVYLALVYAIFFLWFETFPLVFGDIYGFNLGLQGVAFSGLAIGTFLSYAGYAAYQYYYVEPKVRRTGIFVTPEERLLPGFVGSLFVPVSLFMFGWFSRRSIHWIAPIISATLYIPAFFLLFQSCLIYLPATFPLYAASLLAGNDLIRSCAGAGSPLLGHPLFATLGIGGGCSLLAGLSIPMIPILWFFYKRGGEVRKWSKYAQS